MFNQNSMRTNLRRNKIHTILYVGRSYIYIMRLQKRIPKFIFYVNLNGSKAIQKHRVLAFLYFSNENSVTIHRIFFIECTQ